MKRRVFLCGSIATALPMPLAVEAQQPARVYRWHAGDEIRGAQTYWLEKAEAEKARLR